jgi:hypothetical protein
MLPLGHSISVPPLVMLAKVTTGGGPMGNGLHTSAFSSGH